VPSPRRVIVGAWQLAERERRALLTAIVQVSGLMPLLMKPRNRMAWSEPDRRELQAHLRRLRQLSPYIVIFVMPGGFAMLPALAWWLDRRRQKHATPPSDDLPGQPAP